jgi:hypothetical protein
MISLGEKTNLWFDELTGNVIQWNGKGDASTRIATEIHSYAEACESCKLPVPENMRLFAGVNRMGLRTAMGGIGLGKQFKALETEVNLKEARSNRERIDAEKPPVADRITQITGMVTSVGITKKDNKKMVVEQKKQVSKMSASDSIDWGNLTDDEFEPDDSVKRVVETENELEEEFI